MTIRAGVAVAALAQCIGASLPTSSIKEALQAVADRKGAEYNCSMSIALLGGDEDAVAVASSPDNSAEATDMYAFGSGTKPLTGASILKLVSENKFQLDDPVGPLVDPLIKKMVKTYPSLNFNSIADLWGEENAANTTIRKLLTMTSGIPDFDTAKPAMGKNETATDSLRKFLYDNPEKAYTPLELMNFSWVRGNWNDPERHHMLYSSTNFMLLGLVLAQQVGVSSWDQFSQASFLPEALKDHFKFVLRGSPHEVKVVSGYDRTQYNMPSGVLNNKEVSNVNGVFAGWTASDIVASTPHMAELARAVYGPQPAIAPEEYAKLMRNPDSFYGYATFNLNSYTGQPSSSKYGIAYGHLGATYGYQSIVAYMPGFDIALVVASNIETDDQTQPADAFCSAYGSFAGLKIGRDLNCTYSTGGYYGGSCNCDRIDQDVAATHIIV